MPNGKVKKCPSNSLASLRNLISPHPRAVVMLIPLKFLVNIIIS